MTLNLDIYSITDIVTECFSMVKSLSYRKNIDVEINIAPADFMIKVDANKIKPQKYSGKTILLSSVTDPYIPLELKYENTRKILENLVGTKAEINVLTKSKFVVRDIDLFKKFENIL